MPLLMKKPFIKASIPGGLSKKDEVFHCVMTNEIFRDYDQFCQRVILCNSMVWTCRYTDKSGLTYLEALESEKEAQKTLKEFPTQLRVPVLFLASKTHRTAFSEMVDDVYTFMKDRYFIGENVESSFVGNKWRESHVLQVIAPTEQQLKDAPKNGHGNNKHFYPPPSLYSYEVEQLDSEDQDISQVMIVKADQIKRKKKLMRDRIKFFLKKFVVQTENSLYMVKEKCLHAYGISKMNFGQIFDGPLPTFAFSKQKKKKQKFITEFLSGNKNGDITEKIKKQEEVYKQIHEEMKQKKLAEKMKQREENLKIASLVREWYSLKDDQQLEDHKKLPVPTPLQSKVPEKYTGDMLSIMEFTHTFSNFTRTKSFFPNGLTFEIIEQALTQKDLEGPLVDLMQMFLSTIFNLQNMEKQHVSIKVDYSGDEAVKDINGNLSLTEATYLAARASTWSVAHQGLSLNQLPLYALTTTEILRMHLLSSGARVTEHAFRTRYQLRGGYTSEDDPALDLRLKYPHIIKALALNNVNILPIGDKLKLLHCLMNQILTYAEVRDVVEDNVEKSRQAKLDLKLHVVNVRKLEQQFNARRAKIIAEGTGVEWNMEKLEKEYEKKKAANIRAFKSLVKCSTKHHALFGQDRAFRRYLKLDSVPGFIVSTEDDPGKCLDESVKQIPHLVDAEKSVIIAHVRKVYEQVNSSDKKNVNSQDTENIDSSEPTKINGIHNSLDEESDSLLLCSADSSNCRVHSLKKGEKWGFYYQESQIEELIKSLNDRGVRESELKQLIVNDRENLISTVLHTPINILNPDLEIPEPEKDVRLRPRAQVGRPKSDNLNFGYPNDMDTLTILRTMLCDKILEMENGIDSGTIGSLDIEDRNTWRSMIETRDFQNFISTYKIKKERKKIEKLKSEGSNSRPSTPDTTKEYKDPGQFLSSSIEIECEDSDVDYNKLLTLSDDHKLAVQALAFALVQLGYSLEDQYLRKPLGNVCLKGDNKIKGGLREKWEQSLLAATSYDQIFLHYATLDKCILWTRSALLTKCQVCRKQSNAESMILCDACNKGQHLFCFRPKLTAVPKDSWYCRDCQKEIDKQAKLETPEPRTRRRKRVFIDDEEETPVESEDSDENDEEEADETMEYEEEVENEEEEESGEEKSESEVEEEEEEEGEKVENKNKEEKEEKTDEVENGQDYSEESDVDESEKEDRENSDENEICTKCEKGGTLLCCDNCPKLYHLECAKPPLRRVPRGEWLCHHCRREKKIQASENKHSSDENNLYSAQRSGNINNQRRCAARARDMIHGFARSLRRISESEDSDSTSSSSENTNTRKSKRRETEPRDDLPLHNAPLQEVLADVLKQDYAWPFIRPVVKNEVPDYYDIITKPMDFGTIKYKLNMGEYKCDADLMDDAALVFDNCNTYNSVDDEVYKCGVKLLAYFVSRCHEHGLKVSSKLENDVNKPPEAKRLCVD